MVTRKSEEGVRFELVQESIFIFRSLVRMLVRPTFLIGEVHIKAGTT